MNKTPLGHGFYAISPKAAGKLAKEAGKKLPKHGYELRVEHEGCLWWLKRTVHQGKLVWCIFGQSARRDDPIVVSHNAPVRSFTVTTDKYPSDNEDGGCR